MSLDAHELGDQGMMKLHIKNACKAMHHKPKR